MASHSLPVPLPHATRRERDVRVVRTHSLRAVIAVFVALLILLSWLHLIQALEIASTVREIQAKTEELERIERTNNEIRIEIAETLSPSRLAQAAEELGFRPSQPLYVPFPQSSVATPAKGETGDVGTVPGSENWTEDERTLWEYARGELETLLEVEAAR
jgi:cell division protein FtsB